MSLVPFSLLLFSDADECTLFGVEVCKGGFCLDTVGSYECYCKTGQDYDPVRLECTGQTDAQRVCVCTRPIDSARIRKCYRGRWTKIKRVMSIYSAYKDIT